MTRHPSPVIKNEFIADELVAHVSNQLGSMVSLNSVFSGGITVLRLLRRFGCPLTRKDAKQFQAHAETFRAMGVRLVAVGFDVRGARDFLTGGYWPGELYLDPAKEIYRYLDVPRISTLKAMRHLLINRKPLTFARSCFGGHLRGDGFQLGGTYVIDSRENIIFSFEQRNPTSFPDIKQIIQACQVAVADMQESRRTSLSDLYRGSLLVQPPRMSMDGDTRLLEERYPDVSEGPLRDSFWFELSLRELEADFMANKQKALAQIDVAKTAGSSSSVSLESPTDDAPFYSPYSFTAGTLPQDTTTTPPKPHHTLDHPIPIPTV